jgi:Cobalamin adenosyltransferase
MRNYLNPSERIADSRRRLRCCGTIDELISQMGFARSICPDIEVRKRIKALQLDLYSLGGIIAAPAGAKNLAAAVSPGMMNALEAEIHRIKGVPGVLRDGSLFWELPAAAALDVARTRHQFHSGLPKPLGRTFMAVKPAGRVASRHRFLAADAAERRRSALVRGGHSAEAKG